MFRNKELALLELDELEALFAKLTPEEIELLNAECNADPDDPYLPASDRCREQTKKQPTGPYNRDQLMKFLEEQGKNEKDWEQNKVYVREIKGKVWVPPPPPVLPKDQMDDGDAFGSSTSTEWDDVLSGASEADILELAAILGYTGLVNQIQFQAAQIGLFGDKVEGMVGTGWSAAAKSQTLKHVPLEPDNDTDVEESIGRLAKNDSSLTSLNLNNIKNISHEKMKRVIEAVKNNTNLKILTMANIDMPDFVAREIIPMLEENKTLLTLNIESNLLSSGLLSEIVKATLNNQTLIDLRLANQKSQILGTKVEMEIANTISQNNTILRLGLHLNTLGPRSKIQDVLTRNWDQLRLKRLNRD